MKAIWNNTIIAESDNTIVIENNHYFPPESINKEFYKDSKTQTLCPWKGYANYYDLNIDGKVNSDAAWYYADPMSAAKPIQNFVAFWKGVKVVD